MSSRIKDSKYHVLKGVANVRREEGESLHAFFYALFDPGNLHRFSFRAVSQPSPAMNIKHPWVDYCSALEEIEEGSENADQGETMRIVIRQVIEGLKLVEITAENPIALQKLETHLNRSVGSAVQGSVNSFVKVENCAVDAFHSFIAQFRPPAEGTAAPSAAPTEEEGAGDDVTLMEREITLMCQPQVDPLRGKAATSVLPGDVILVKIPEDSIFFSMLRRARGGLFDGVVEAMVTRVDRHSPETVVMETALAENIKGRVPAPNTLRVKLSPSSVQNAESAPSASVVWILVGGATLVAGALLWYFLM